MIPPFPSNHQLYQLLDQCPVPVYVHQDSILVYANPATFEALRFSPDEIRSAIGSLNVFSLVAPEERDVALSNRDRIIRRSEPMSNIQRVLIDRTGRRRMSVGSARPILWNGRPALEVSFILLDEVSRPEAAGRNEALTRLSDRERQISLLVARGMSTVNIASSLGITEHTVRTILRDAFRKTGTHTRIDLTRLLMGLSNN